MTTAAAKTQTWNLCYFFMNMQSGMWYTLVISPGQGESQPLCAPRTTPQKQEENVCHCHTVPKTTCCEDTAIIISHSVSHRLALLHAYVFSTQTHTGLGQAKDGRGHDSVTHNVDGRLQMVNRFFGTRRVIQVYTTSKTQIMSSK